MGGIKTWIAGAIGIISGVVMLLTVVLSMMSGMAIPEGVSIVAGIGLITGGLGMIGIGHKVEKAAETIKAGG